MTGAAARLAEVLAALGEGSAFGRGPAPARAGGPDPVPGTAGSDRADAPDVVELLDALLLAAARNARAPTVSERAGRRASGAKPVGTPGKASRHAPEEDAAPGEEPAEPPAQDTAGADVWLEQPGSTHSVPGVRHSAGRVDALPDAQGIGRALRPLRYRRPSATRRHLDVDATVDHFTQTGLLVPQLAATPESWLEAVVVLDGGTAMTVWDAPVRRLVSVLRELGAFRDVRLWHLEHPPGRPPRLLDHRGRVLDPALGNRLLRQPANRLLLVISDCAAPAWREPALWQALHAWGSTAPMALINPLPTRLWRHSGLDLPRTTVVAPAPAATGLRLGWRRPRLLQVTPETRPWVSLPVLPLEAERVEAWTRALMRMDPEGCEAVLVPATGRVPRRRAHTRTAPRPEPQVADRAEAFLRDASPSAIRLAVAVAPLDAFTLPVLDVLRERVVPEAGLTDTAEFLTAGMLTVNRNGGGSDPLYRFRPQAADVLLKRLSREQLWETHIAFSEHLEAKLHSPHGIRTVVSDPRKADEVPVGLRPIARAVGATARLLGVEEELSEQRPGAVVELTLTGHEWSIKSLAYSPDGTRLATSSRDSTVRIWDTRTGECVIRLRRHVGPVYDVAYSPDGAHIATAGDDRTLCIWNADSGALRAELTGHTGQIWSVFYSPDGAHIATAGGDGTVRIWNARTNDCVHTLDGHKSSMYAAACSPDGVLATVDSQQHILFWDLSTGRVRTTFEGHTGHVQIIAFSPDNTQLIIVGNDGTTEVLDVSTGTVIHHLTGGVGAVGYSPDGTRIATADSKTVRIWDAVTGDCIYTMAEYATTPVAVAFSPDGTRIATAGNDGQAHVRAVPPARP
ncbi:WD-40 repeat-containing protein [Actinobacteria bacterium OK006]|nr:WD-40 repeat-containing protein [Actinobacteria bacterium OK006]